MITEKAKFVKRSQVVTSNFEHKSEEQHFFVAQVAATKYFYANSCKFYNNIKTGLQRIIRRGMYPKSG